MTAQASARTAVTIALGSIAFTLTVWAWMLTRPAGTFHDQGGLAITFLYFPATFVVWSLCGLTSVALHRRSTEGESLVVADRVGDLRRVVHGLIALGLLLSIGTLFVA
ncbi:MAG: hypothetical protein ACKO0W_04145 [Planctomycetota bacterium]